MSASQRMRSRGRSDGGSASPRKDIYGSTRQKADLPPVGARRLGAAGLCGRRAAAGRRGLPDPRGGGPGLAGHAAQLCGHVRPCPHPDVAHPPPASQGACTGAAAERKGAGALHALLRGRGLLLQHDHRRRHRAAPEFFGQAAQRRDPEHGRIHPHAAAHPAGRSGCAGL